MTLIEKNAKISILNTDLTESLYFNENFKLRTKTLSKKIYEDRATS